MTFLSPGVNVTEKNIGFGVTSLPSSNVFSVIRSTTGPAFKVELVSSEANLLKKYGKPDKNNYKDWFNTNNFYSYSESMNVSRPIDSAKITKNAGVALSSGMSGSALSFTDITNLPAVGDIISQAAGSITARVSFVYQPNTLSGNVSEIYVTNIVGIWTAAATINETQASESVGTPAGAPTAQTVSVKIREDVRTGDIYNDDIADVTLSALVTDSHQIPLATYDGTTSNLVYSANGTVQGNATARKGSGSTDSVIIQTGPTGAKVDAIQIQGTELSRTLDLLDSTHLAGWELDGVLTVDGVASPPFADGEVITGATSGHTATIVSGATGTAWTLSNVTGAFTDGETISGDLAGVGETCNSATTEQTITAWTLGGVSGDETVIGSIIESKLTIYNRYVSSAQNIAIGVCSSEAAWHENVSTNLSNKFSSYFDVKPNFYGSEFALLVFEVETDGTFTQIEKHIVSYLSSAKDIFNKSAFVEDVLLKADSKIFAKVGTTGTVVNTAPGTLVQLQEAWFDTVYPRVADIFPSTVYDPSGYAQGDIDACFDLIDDPDTSDIGLILQHELSVNKASTVAAIRLDALAINAPFDHTSLVGKTSDESVAYLTKNMGTGIDYDTTSSDSDFLSTFNTYTGVYGNMKYQYDKYSDINRWIPIHGDVAGLFAETDRILFPWYAVAGVQRGVIKNAIKLAFNPNKTGRDSLYSQSINVVYAIPGEGSAIVYGQKTSTGTASIFDRINVRRLMLTIEKAISKAMRPFIMEFADQATWDAIAGVINPYLNRVKTNRGLIDYLVVVDSSNNTAQVIDDNQIVIDIFVKPTAVAEFIQINFSVTSSGVEFSELIA